MSDFTESQHNFMMDAENWILEKHWKQGIEPLRRFKRATNPEWLELIENHTEINLSLYCEWVMKGNGDDWFIE